MRVVPKDKLGVVDFFTAHAPVWQAEAGSIGLAPADAEAVAEAAAEAREAFEQQQAAQQAARAATLVYENALDRLRAAGAVCIAKVRVAAMDAGDDGAHVYSLAQLPMPARPGRMGEPGLPTRFVSTLLPGGAVRLTWQCKNPTGSVGTVYEIRRSDCRDAGGGREWGGFAYVGIAGSKSFVDETIPAGLAAVQYQVTAVRSTRRGQPARHLVMFGSAGAMAA